MAGKKRSSVKRKGKVSTKRSKADEGLPGTIRTGMPSKDSVIGETDFESPKGTKYRIIKTTEIDTYDTDERKDKDP